MMTFPLSKFLSECKSLCSGYMRHESGIVVHISDLLIFVKYFEE